MYRKFSFEICLMFCPGEKWVEQSSWWTEVQPIPYNLGFFKLRQQEKGTKFYGVSDVCPLAERMSRGRKKGWSITESLEFILEFVPAINQRWPELKNWEGHKGKINYSCLAISFLHKLISLIINFDFVCFAIFLLEIWYSDSNSEPLRPTLVCNKTFLYFGRISFWHGWTTKSCRKVMKKRSNVKVMAEPLFTLVKVGANQKKRGLLENFWFWFSKFCMRRQESKTLI